jgi:hypothetical protein
MWKSWGRWQELSVLSMKDQLGLFCKQTGVQVHLFIANRTGEIQKSTDKKESVFRIKVLQASIGTHVI